MSLETCWAFNERWNNKFYYRVASCWLFLLSYKYGTADTLTQEIFNFPARRQKAVKCKMALISQQRGWWVLEFHKTNSFVTVQRAFTRKFNVDPPTNKSILKWHRNFIERACIYDQRKGHSGRPSVSEQLSTRSRRICCRESGPG
jgi:hypothetical protein